MVILLHLLFLHYSGRTNTIFTHRAVEKVPFFPYFVVKDGLNLVVYIFVLTLMLLFPYRLREPELYIEANPLNSPVHISPEWYFLQFYALLRCVPSKRLGLVLMVLRLLLNFTLVGVGNYISPTSTTLKGWTLFSVALFFILTYLGRCPLRSPYLFVAAFASILFFISYMILYFL